MSKTLLVLAASTYQVPVIEAAKRLGYRVVTTDNTPDNPGHALADASYGVDTTDTEGVLSVAQTEGIDGVIAAATDVAVASAAFVSERLGLPGPSKEAAAVLTEKRRFRRFMADAGLPSPRTLPVSEDGLHALNALGRRWLIKPNRASGSKGIRILNSRDDLRAQLPESQSASLDGEVVLEELIEGSQHTCEGLLEDGEIPLALITDRDVAQPPHTATAGHRAPSHLDAGARALVLETIRMVLTRLGIRDGPFDCDFVWDDRRPVLIEMTPRTGGNSLPRLIQATVGFDLIDYAVRHACGEAVAVPRVPAPRPSAVVILGVDETGRLRWNRTEEQALRREPWVRDLIIDLPHGAPVEPFTDGRHRIGEALIQAEGRAELDTRVDELRQRLNAAAA